MKTLYANPAVSDVETIPEQFEKLTIKYSHTGILDPPDSYQTPSVDHVKSELTDSDNQKPIVLNFEHDDDEVKLWGVTAGTLCRIHQVTDQPLGVYRLLPERNYWAAIKGGDSYKKWQEKNDRVKAVIGPHVDRLYPSVYIFYDLQKEGNMKKAKQYITEHLKEADRVSDGKPIYPFLMMKYHPGGDAANRLIEPEFFGELVQHILEAPQSDGIVLFGDAGDAPTTHQYYDIAARAAGFKIPVPVPESKE